MTGSLRTWMNSFASGHQQLAGQVARFMAIGLASTALNLALFAALDQAMTHQVANVVSLVLCSIVNTAVNRRYTFRVRGSRGHARVQLQALALLAVTWCLTALALLVLQHLQPHSGTLLATITVAIGNLLATAVRFVLFRRWFAPQLPDAEGALPTL